MENIYIHNCICLFKEKQHSIYINSYTLISENKLLVLLAVVTAF